MNSSNSRAEEWLHYFYEQQVREMGPSVHAVNVTSSSDVHVAVQDSSGRRARASRRAKPTTLLNANPSNFRALVQQFTGRSSGGANSVRRRGPVTLDFGSPSSVSEDDIFPRSGGGGYERSNYDNTLRGAWTRREGAAEGGKGTASYRIGQDSGPVFRGACDDYHGHDDGAMREFSGDINNNGHGMDDRMDNDYLYHDLCDTSMLEELMMDDYDRMLD